MVWMATHSHGQTICLFTTTILEACLHHRCIKTISLPAFLPWLIPLDVLKSQTHYHHPTLHLEMNSQQLLNPATSIKASMDIASLLNPQHDLQPSSSSSANSNSNSNSPQHAQPFYPLRTPFQKYTPQRDAGAASQRAIKNVSTDRTWKGMSPKGQEDAWKKYLTTGQGAWGYSHKNAVLVWVLGPVATAAASRREEGVLYGVFASLLSGVELNLGGLLKRTRCGGRGYLDNLIMLHGIIKFDDPLFLFCLLSLASLSLLSPTPTVKSSQPDAFGCLWSLGRAES